MTGTDSGARGQIGLVFSADGVADRLQPENMERSVCTPCMSSTMPNLHQLQNQMLHLTYVVHQLIRPTARAILMVAAS